MLPTMLRFSAGGKEVTIESPFDWPPPKALWASFTNGNVVSISLVQDDQRLYHRAAMSQLPPDMKNVIRGATYLPVD